VKRESTPLRECKTCLTSFKPTHGASAYCSHICKAKQTKIVKDKYLASEQGKAKTRDYNKKYQRFANRREMRDRNLRMAYGIGIDEFEAMEKAQGGLCAICKKEPIGPRPLGVDHCHATLKNRGLLCINCNNMLGNAGDSIKRLEDGIAYLILHETPQKD
jgi:hypothetical protein